MQRGRSRRCDHWPCWVSLGSQGGYRAFQAAEAQVKGQSIRNVFFSVAELRWLLVWMSNLDVPGSQYCANRDLRRTSAHCHSPTGRTQRLSTHQPANVESLLLSNHDLRRRRGTRGSCPCDGQTGWRLRFFRSVCRVVVGHRGGTTAGRMRTDGERHGGAALADRRNERRSGAPTRPRHHQKEQPNRQWDLNGRMLGVGFGFFDVHALDEATGARGGSHCLMRALIGQLSHPTQQREHTKRPVV